MDNHETNELRDASFSPLSPAASGTIEADIEKLVYGGQGLARVEGRVVLTPFVLPGERARIEILKERRGFAQGRLLDVLNAATGRTDPPCPYFYRCGGCQYQHASYEVQLEAKRAILRETLERVGKVEAPPEIHTISGEPWAYRNRTQFHIAGNRIGYYEFASHRLCPVTECPISSPRINVTLRTLSEMLQDRRFPKFIRSIEVFTNESEVQLNVLVSEGGKGIARSFFNWAAEQIPGAAAGTLDYTVGGETYRVGYSSFFQVNRFLTSEIVRCALEGAVGESALDLYAGVGLFAIPLARRIPKVTAVESGAGAVRDLEFNASQAGLRIQAIGERVESFLGSVQTSPDFVLADPPRAGLGAAAVHELLRLRPRRLTIVSCDPATLARDLSPLTQGGFRIERLTLVDLFPQTFHIEAVTHLICE